MKKRIFSITLLLIVGILITSYCYWRYSSRSSGQKEDLLIAEVPTTHEVIRKFPARGHEQHFAHNRKAIDFKHLPPPVNSPWTVVYNELQKRSAAGDPVAAARLFRDTMRCINYVSTKERIDRILNMYSGGLPSEQTLHDYDVALSKLQQELKDATPICGQVDRSKLTQALYSVVLQAAESGDPMAQNCYVDARIFEQSKLDPAEMNQIRANYAENALQIAQSGMGSGNWTMVFLLEQAYSSTPADIGERGWLGAIIQPDPLAMYSYLLLEQFGQQAVGSGSNAQAKISRVQDAYKFSSAEIDSAQNWAERVYAAHFAHSVYPNSSTGVVCGIE